MAARLNKTTQLYADFITKNAGAVSQIESALRSLTYIVPARFQDAELASEAVHSSISLLSLYHDSLLARSISSSTSNKPADKPTPHNRYTRFWTKQSPSYRRLALLITIIQYTELLWEMTSQRRGQQTKWRVIVTLEAAKAICRLWLLKLTQSRPLLTPPLPERELIPEEEENLGPVDISGDNSDADSIAEKKPEEPWQMPRTGLSLPSLPDPNKISQYLLSKVLTPEDVKPPQQLLHRVKGLGYLAEVVYIIRPVVYAVALMKMRNDKKSWTPWLLGFSLEFMARQLRKRELEQGVPGGLRGLTGLEKDELSRRAYAMAWWGVRGAAYENVTGPILKNLSDKLNNQPVLGLLGGILADYQYLWDNYYFSSATL
ncbi:peroxisome membrane protein [Pyronema omphalodes]|nr:peroxisome membrane protein [Pyronema omphalodes]